MLLVAAQWIRRLQPRWQQGWIAERRTRRVECAGGHALGELLRRSGWLLGHGRRAAESGLARHVTGTRLVRMLARIVRMIRPRRREMHRVAFRVAVRRQHVGECLRGWLLQRRVLLVLRGLVLHCARWPCKLASRGQAITTALATGLGARVSRSRRADFWV